jgi:hypothetical protein
VHYLTVFDKMFIGDVRQNNLSLQFRKIKRKKYFPPCVERRQIIATLLRALGIGERTMYVGKPGGLPQRPNKKHYG